MSKWIVLVRAHAVRDIEEARDWYDQKRAGLGNEFVDAMAGGMRKLETDPEAERFYYRRFRRVLLRRFPYKIFYQVIAKRVVVFRVLHAKQDHTRQLRGG